MTPLTAFLLGNVTGALVLAGVGIAFFLLVCDAKDEEMR